MYSTTTTGSTATPSATLPGKTSHPVKLLASETSSDSDISLIYTSPPYFTASSSLQSHLALQTVPSVPSLQSLSHRDTFRLSLSSPPLSLTSSSLQPITALGFSVINSGLLYAASGHNITVYDPTTSIHLETFNSNCAFSGSVKSIAFCNGKIFTAHQDGKIRAWKINAAKRHHRLMATLPTVSDRLRHFPLPGNYVQVRRHKKSLWIEHNDAVSGLAVNNSLGLVYSVSWDKTLKIWRASGMKCLESVTAHDDAVNAVTVSVDGVVYTGSADMRIRVWVRPERKKRHALVATLEKHKSAVNALALSLDGSVLFSGSCDRSILVWGAEGT